MSGVAEVGGHRADDGHGGQVAAQPLPTGAGGRPVPAQAAGARIPLDDPAAAHLTFRTLRLSGPEELGAESQTGLTDLLAGRDDAVSWVRHGQGLVGWGRVLTLTAAGPERIAVLRRTWRGVVGAATWEDAVRRPGSGPMALGAVTFSADSAATSLLLVPRVLVGRGAEGWWLTVAGPADAVLPGVVQVRAEVEAHLHRVSARTTRTTGAGAGGTAGAGAAKTAGSTGAGAGGPDPATASPRATVRDGVLSPSGFEAAVATVSALLRAGEAQKVVLARDVVVRPGMPVTAGDLVGRLAAAYPSCWAFAVDTMVGATPELLVRLDDRHLTSRVLAGTARRRTGMDEAAVEELSRWLAGSPKNRREHALARDSATRALEPLCAEVNAPTEPTVLRLPNVLHLASDLTGTTAGDTGVLSLVAALHPTAAVCGTPTPVAAAVIAEVERMDRGRYAGPVGWVDWHGAGEWCLALRCGERLEDGAWRVLGGGGIMPDSDPADELAETAAKMRPMLDALDPLPAARTGAGAGVRSPFAPRG